MKKYFNTTGLCTPGRHFMVNMESRIKSVKKYIERGEYFTINRARQYGKTTLIHLLEKALTEEYFVLSLSFEGIEKEGFEEVNSFCQRICRASLSIIPQSKIKSDF